MESRVSHSHYSDSSYCYSTNLRCLINLLPLYSHAKILKMHSDFQDIVSSVLMLHQTDDFVSYNITKKMHIIDNSADQFFCLNLPSKLQLVLYWVLVEHLVTPIIPAVNSDTTQQNCDTTQQQHTKIDKMFKYYLSEQWEYRVL